MDKIREYLIIAKLISKEIMGLNDSDEENKLQNWMTKNDRTD